MTIEFLKKRKELKKIKEILKRIQELEEKSKTATSFRLINTKFVKDSLAKATQNSIDNKNSFSIDYTYKIIKQWDEYGDMPQEVGDLLEELIQDENYVIGIHRTGGYGMIDVEDIYRSDMLHSIFSKGLYMTGDLSTGVDHQGQMLNPNKNISPLNNIIEAVMYCKSSYKDSTGGVITKIPKEYVTTSYSLKAEHGQDIYEKVDNQWTLKPKYLVGFVSQEKGVCKFYSKEEILTNYKSNQK